MSPRLVPRYGSLTTTTATLPHQPTPTSTPIAPLRHFSTSSTRNVADHYATLEVSSTASAPEIKKQFYKLSKAYHPDHNPQDAETSSKKFMAISEAYHILGNPSKRDKYDRELAQSRGVSSPSGSYSSAGGYSPGGRKASGLSKRRSQFRGPPPSFYRSGGWGSSSEKREANMGRDARDHEAWRRQQQQQQANSSSGATSRAGADKGSAWPFSTDSNDVGHFDRDGHFRTQTSVQEQLQKGRMKRRAVFQRRQGALDPERESSDLSRFIWVVSLFSISAVLLPVWAVKW